MNKPNINHLLTSSGTVNSAITRQSWFKSSKLYNDILEYTIFLNVVEDVKISNRIIAIRDNITEVELCPICKKPKALDPRKNIFWRATCNNKDCATRSMLIKRTKKYIKNPNIFKKTIKDRTIFQVNNIKDMYNMFVNNKYILISHSDVLDFINNILSKMKKNSAMISAKHYNHHKDMLCSILEYTNFLYNIDIKEINKITTPSDVSFNWSERFYCIIHDIKTRQTCKYCSEYSKYSNINDGYFLTCKLHSHVIGSTTRKNNIEAKLIEILPKYGCELISFDGLNSKPVVMKCIKCGCIFKKYLYNGKINNLIHTMCPNCFPQSISHYEIDIVRYLKSLKISDDHIVTNTRSIIPPLELDLFIPSLKTAIEFNGTYWHSENAGKTDRKYHLNKTQLCNARNIRLIHIFEDEWNNKRMIVKSRIKAILNKTPYRIFARKTEVRELTNQIKNMFLDKYHIQGQDKSSIKLGLYYKNRLVAVMTFGKARYNKSYEYELIRYCTVSNFNIVGGAGKLLKYFERIYSPKSLITYADLRWSNGELYKALGFKFEKQSPPNYWYLRDYCGYRESRQNYQKHKLKEKLDTFDENITEWENMKANGFDRIWDCGNLVFSLSFDK